LAYDGEAASVGAADSTASLGAADSTASLGAAESTGATDDPDVAPGAVVLPAGEQATRAAPRAVIIKRRLIIVDSPGY